MDYSAAQRKSEEAKQAYDVPKEVGSVLSPPVRLIEDLENRGYGDECYKQQGHPLRDLTHAASIRGQWDRSKSLEQPPLFVCHATNARTLDEANVFGKRSAVGFVGRHPPIVTASGKFLVRE